MSPEPAATRRQRADVGELRFDRRVAIVTGAGGALGQAYARQLAERGAQLVVNDLGGSVEGFGADAQPARAIADEICSQGGIAVPSFDSVASEEGAGAIIDTALEHFGRIDVVVNSAGVYTSAEFEETTLETLVRHLSVHVGGSFNITRAAWPVMRERGYGRVVLTTSAAVFGADKLTAYAAAKAGVIGLGRSLAVAGRGCGIKVNVLAPQAMSRMTGPLPADASAEVRARRARRRPEYVAPALAYLAHEVCESSGETFAVGGGAMARIFLGETRAVPSATTPEEVREIWGEMNDLSTFRTPEDLGEYMTEFADSNGQLPATEV